MRGEGFEYWVRLAEQYRELTHEEEGQLAQMRKDGDKGAAHQLVLHNIPDLIRKVKARNWQDIDEIGDLMTHAYEGMFKAALKWEQVHKEGHAKPARFMHYAFLYIKAELNKFCNKFGGEPMLSLDSRCGEDRNLHEVITAEDTKGELGVADYADLEIFGCLSKTQREIFLSRVVHDHGDDDDDLAYLCRVKSDNVNKHLAKAALKLIEATDFDVSEDLVLTA